MMPLLLKTIKLMSQSLIRRSKVSLVSSRASSVRSVDPSKDLIFKMSKKIAQLTKVVYYLNTKTEDHTLHAEVLKHEYDQELADTIKDGASIIQELQLKFTESQSARDHQESLLIQGSEALRIAIGKLDTANELRITAVEE